jgi:hypothetical protein
MANFAVLAGVFIAGVITGAFFMATVASAAMHRSQMHMQKKVRYWQGRWRQARRWRRRIKY